MLDKLLLNNQLISNKNKVQQAKVNAINKLVQKIRKLKKINEKKPDDNKIRKKLDKSMEVLSCLKEIKNVDLLKRALLNTKNPTAIITNGTSTSEDIAHAILFNHKIIAEITHHLKNLLNLDDASNQGWRDEILELSKKQKKFLRTEKKKKIREERKTRNELELKRNEWLEENVPESIREENKNEGNFVNNEQQSDDVWKVENVAAKISKIKQTRKTTQEKQNKSSEEKKVIIEDRRTVDPFFITQNGENYLSSVEIDCMPSDDNDKSKTTKKFMHFNRNLQRNEDFNNKKTQFSKNLNGQNKNYGTNEIHPSWKAKKRFQSIQEFKGKKIVFGDDNSSNNDIKTKENSINTDLHPSWAAKQKMKPTIKEFQGKKIVFDDNE